MARTDVGVMRRAAAWSEWRRPRPDPSIQRSDLAITAGMFAGMVIVMLAVNGMGAQTFGTAPSLQEQLVWGTALSLPLVARRRFPVAVLLVVGAVFIAAQARQIGDNTVPSVCVFLASYSVGAWERNRRLAHWSRVVVIIAMFLWLAVSFITAMAEDFPDFPGSTGPFDPVLASVVYALLFNGVFFGAAYFFGNMAWETARRRAELEERNDQLRRSQEENLRGALVAERVRIARDLHDVVAHSVSVMGIQAGAARRTLDRDPALAGEALQTVEETARSAIGELRGLLGVLRSEPDPAEIDGDATAGAGEAALGHDVSGGSGDGEGDPGLRAASPGLSDLPELVSRMDAAGIEARYGVYGDQRPVPDAVALSAYRIVQEGLTNVAKHSGAEEVDVRVRYLASALEVEIVDDGYGRSSAGGSGLGQAGMRERAAVHGGEVEVGPRENGRGYRVWVSMPLGPRPVSPHTQEETG
ncbi:MULTISPECIES: sensor histidine kinase [Prauserella salsuginis group]|uniref:histidine kinase n=2 Tax=Prauserella salsuginis group TaxID=2893672 RepID=A0A839XJ98_9PSEU|nr:MULTISPECIES: sensor histidine kinase [Prauserella salsuginis group]MBB3664012.1 signal transduction histidine kinase [Prauserella sediminis]MCR3721467.1 Signal transduction histidine kinase [Prauserella flava]MCR3732457.1 Signal transduction histidine kinase [Prauserella salsuginis]